MTRNRWLIVLGVIIVVGAAAVGLSLAIGGGDGDSTAATTQTDSTAPRGLAGLYAATRLGTKEAVVLAHWPKIPYQHYSDNLGEDCYEWQGDNLYNLCFMNGVLHLKTAF
jgi:hypothetical protein